MVNDGKHENLCEIIYNGLSKEAFSLKNSMCKNYSHESVFLV